MYKLIILTIAFCATFAAAAPGLMSRRARIIPGSPSVYARGSSVESYLNDQNYELNQGLGGLNRSPRASLSKIESLQRHFRESRPARNALVEHEASTLNQENMTESEHSSEGKNNNSRLRQANKQKIKNVHEKEKFNNEDEEVKQTADLYHSKKSKTNYSRVLNKTKTTDKSNYDRDENSHSKLVHKKNNAVNRLKKNHVKDGLGSHMKTSEAYDDVNEEEYTQSI